MFTAEELREIGIDPSFLSTINELVAKHGLTKEEAAWSLRKYIAQALQEIHEEQCRQAMSGETANRARESRRWCEEQGLLPRSSGTNRRMSMEDDMRRVDLSSPAVRGPWILARAKALEAERRISFEQAHMIACEEAKGDATSIVATDEEEAFARARKKRAGGDRRTLAELVAEAAKEMNQEAYDAEIQKSGTKHVPDATVGKLDRVQIDEQGRMVLRGRASAVTPLGADVGARVLACHGRNVTEQAMAFVRSQPGGERLSFDDIHARACDIVRGLRAGGAL